MKRFIGGIMRMVREMGFARGCALLAVTGLLSAALFTPSSRAQGNPEGATQQLSGWTVRGGALWRNIQADFRAPAPGGLLDWKALTPGMQTGGGDTSLYDGTGTVTYEDGSVFAGPWIPGAASGSVQNDDQIVQEPNPFGVFPPGTGYGRVTFHSSRLGYSSETDQTPFSQDADSDVIQPFISASRPLWQGPGGGAVSFLGRYGFADTDLTSPWAQTAVQRIIQHGTVYHFEYDIAMEAGFPIPSAPFTSHFRCESMQR